MAFNNQAYENGNAFSHKDGKLTIGGIELPSCTDFKIGVTSTVTQNAGMGGAPVSFGTESEATEGSFTIDQKDLIKLSALSPTGMLPRALSVPGFFLQENEVGNKTGLDGLTPNLKMMELRPQQETPKQLSQLILNALI